MINIILVGVNGKMGQVICRILEENNTAQVVCGIDINTERKNGFPVYSSFDDVSEECDVIIDFSHPSSLENTLSYCVKNKKAAVIATTGLSAQQIDSIEAVSKEIPVFFSANMSLGVNLLIQLAKKATALLEDNFDIEIIEKHHNLKIDAPSGTALAIADAINDTCTHSNEYIYDRHSMRKKRSKNEIGIHSLRGGTIVGEHSVIFAGNDEIIELKHTASSKEIFAVGAVKAASFVADKAPGLYNMDNLIEGIC
ncbi:MAG: 4-hydroxy-tetrahydrodipicolinate reductase [Ruminococcaceae bacterium]|nr:4-hydroxy-tetrahydrodipicolinate reductase [Oscillospiraceae bacterium]